MNLSSESTSVNFPAEMERRFQGNRWVRMEDGVHCLADARETNFRSENNALVVNLP